MLSSPLPPPPPPAPPSHNFLIVGGCGYVGQKLTLALLQRDPMSQILIADSNIYDIFTRDSRVKFILLDICNYIKVDELFEEQQRAGNGITFVIHLASYGMSGSAMLDRPLCQKVNVVALNNLVETAIKYSAARFIYTSTYNVVFKGQPIRNGDEKMGYSPSALDAYGATKAAAEKLVLQANGRRLGQGIFDSTGADTGTGTGTCSSSSNNSNNTTSNTSSATSTTSQYLITAAIRPAAIYGEHEQRHLPRILSHIDSDVFIFRIGQKSVVDWVYIDNLVDAFVLLVEKMTTASSPAVAPAGHAYFISDGCPMDNFEFLRPLFAARGKPFPGLEVPVLLALWGGFLMEKLWLITSCFGCPVEPLMNRSEVHKVGVTHFFSINKARKHLNYHPKVTSTEGLRRVAEVVAAEREPQKSKHYFKVAHPLWFLVIFTGLALFYAVAFDVFGLGDTSGDVVTGVLESGFVGISDDLAKTAQEAFSLLLTAKADFAVILTSNTINYRKWYLPLALFSRDLLFLVVKRLLVQPFAIAYSVIDRIGLIVFACPSGRYEDRVVMRFGVFAAAAAHVGEAVFAWYVATGRGQSRGDRCAGGVGIANGNEEEEEGEDGDRDGDRDGVRRADGVVSEGSSSSKATNAVATANKKLLSSSVAAVSSSSSSPPSPSPPSSSSPSSPPSSSSSAAAATISTTLHLEPAAVAAWVIQTLLLGYPSLSLLLAREKIASDAIKAQRRKEAMDLK